MFTRGVFYVLKIWMEFKIVIIKCILILKSIQDIPSLTEWENVIYPKDICKPKVKNKGYLKNIFVLTTF